MGLGEKLKSMKKEKKKKEMDDGEKFSKNLFFFISA